VFEVILEAKKGEENDEVSHGICLKCARIQRAELKEAKREMALEERGVK